MDMDKLEHKVSFFRYPGKMFADLYEQENISLAKYSKTVLTSYSHIIKTMQMLEKNKYITSKIRGRERIMSLTVQGKSLTTDFKQLKELGIR